MRKCDGIVLLNVLIFLQIFAILSIFAFQQIFLVTKQNNHLWHKHIIYDFAEKALTVAENKLANVSPGCLISVTPTAVLLKNPLNWWQSTLTCAGNFSAFQYYYVVEFLGTDPCAEVQLYPAKAVANFFRITLLGITKDAKVVLQSTLITPNYTDSQKCDETSRIVTMGRQKWRELYFN